MKKLIPACQDLASSEGAAVSQGEMCGEAWRKTWKGKVRHLYFTVSHCATFDHSYWVWCYFFWHQCPTLTPQGVSAPRYTPSIIGGLNQTQHISKLKATFCQVAQPRDRAWHWCGRHGPGLRATWVNQRVSLPSPGNVTLPKAGSIQVTLDHSQCLAMAGGDASVQTAQGSGVLQ